MWQRYLLDPLRGRWPLSRAVWIYGIALTVLYLLLESLFPGSRTGKGLYYLLGVLVTVLQSVVLWQCAFNAKSRAYGYVLRVLVVVGLVLMPYLLYVLWSHPELAELMGEPLPG